MSDKINQAVLPTRSILVRCLGQVTVISGLLWMIVLSACTSLTVRSADDVRELAGTYEGSGVLSCCPPVFLFETLVIHEDGSYDLSGRVNAKGMVKAEGSYIKLGPFDLSVYDYGKSRVLQGTGLGTQVAFSQRR